MYPFSSKDFLLDLIGEDDGRVPQIFISYALNYCCVFVIFSLFRPFFSGQVKLFQLKFTPNIYMPPQTILYGKMRCTNIDSLFSCFECIIYYLIFFVTTLCFMVIIQLPPPLKKSANPKLYSQFSCVFLVLYNNHFILTNMLDSNILCRICSLL